MIRICVLVAMVGRASAAPLLPVTTEKLDNGLTVVLAPDASASAVAVHVRYRVGAGDERPEQAGFTRLVERLLFAGSPHVKAGELEQRIDDAGGFASSVTTVDHLSVFEQVPPEALELALWLEAERMAGFADGITDAALARAKTELAAEWRSAYVDQPYALVARKLQELLWPAHHPNAHLVLGDGRLRATLAQVRAFARQHITPSLTTLVIAGRFELQPTRELVKKYFAWIPPSKRGPSLARASAAPLAKSRTEAVVDPIPHVVVAFPIDKPYSPDAIAIEVAGHMLAGGRASRLSRKLADSASNVHAELVRQRSGCELVIEATPNPGVDAKSVFMQIVLEINELRRGTTDDEVRRAQAAVDSELVSALESLVFRADTLAAWADYTGDAQFLDRLRGTYHAVTADSIQRAANRWLATHAGVIATGGR